MSANKLLPDEFIVSLLDKYGNPARKASDISTYVFRLSDGGQTSIPLDDIPEPDRSRMQRRLWRDPGAVIHEWILAGAEHLKEEVRDMSRAEARAYLERLEEEIAKVTTWPN